VSRSRYHSVFGDARIRLLGAGRFSPLLVAGLCFLVSCAKGPEGVAPKEEGIRRESDRGPVKVILSVDRSEVTIAQRIHLNIEIISDEEYEARLAPFGDQLEQFGIVDYKTSQPELIEGNKVRIGRSYVLEPFLSGEYTIPAMKIAFVKKSDDSGKEYEIETEEIKIKVTSLLPENLEELKIHDVLAPVELPRSKAPAIGFIAVLALLVGAILTVLIVRKRSERSPNIAETISAHELAIRALEKLVAEDLIKRGEIKQFYQRVSGILRTYIENRFGLRAPEQTTEEFLSTIGMSKDFPDQFRSLLDTFLTHCDLVKFAELRPTTEDIQRSFDSCKAFVIGTRKGPETGVRKLEY